VSPRNLHDEERIEDMDGRIRMIPGVAEAIIAVAAERFPVAYTTLTLERSQMWLNCKSNATPSATAPLRHHGQCKGQFRVIVRHPSMGDDEHGAAISLRVSDKRSADVQVTTGQFAELTRIHDDFASSYRHH